MPLAAGQLLLGGAGLRDELRLGLAVQAVQHRSQQLGRLPQPGRCGGGAAVADAGQAGQVGVGDVRVVQQPVQQRRQQPGVGDALALDGGQDVPGVEVVPQDDRTALQEGRVGEDPGEVGERGAGQEARRVTRAGEAALQAAPVGAVAHADALGDPGGPARVADAPVVVRPHRRAQGTHRVPGDRGQDVLGEVARAQGQHRRDTGQRQQFPRQGVPPAVHQQQDAVHARQDVGHDRGAHALVEDDDPRAGQVGGVAGGEAFGAVAGEQADRGAPADPAPLQFRAEPADLVAQAPRADHGSLRGRQDRPGRFGCQDVEDGLRVGGEVRPRGVVLPAHRLSPSVESVSVDVLDARGGPFMTSTTGYGMYS
ncbi:hypothetical protein STENM223S_09795 [Streptomyces tendae]